MARQETILIVEPEVSDCLRTRLRRGSHLQSCTLSDYLDESLALRERADLEAHLHECVKCRALPVSRSGTVHALGSLRRVAPVELADSIIAALRAAI